MKKIVLILLAAVFFVSIFSSCAATDENAPKPEVVFNSGIYPFRDWEAPKGSYTKDAVPNEETAVRTARAVFNRMYEGQIAEKYPAISLVYDDIDEVWIVLFKTTETTMGGYTIALQKSDGKILKISHGE